VNAKDVALQIVRLLGTDGATYSTIEFMGPVADALPAEGRRVIANMSAEAGAKAGIFTTPDWCSDSSVKPAREIPIDGSQLEPIVALPHSPANGVPVSEAVGSAIDWVFLGTCTGGSASDLREALQVLDAGGGIAHGVMHWRLSKRSSGSVAGARRRGRHCAWRDSCGDAAIFPRTGRSRTRRDT